MKGGARHCRPHAARTARPFTDAGRREVAALRAPTAPARQTAGPASRGRGRGERVCVCPSPCVREGGRGMWGGVGVVGGAGRGERARAGWRGRRGVGA